MSAPRGLRLIPPFLALAWGLNWPAVKIMLLHLPPFMARSFGLAGGALLLAIAAVLQGRRLWPQRAAWPNVAVGSVFTVIAFNFLTAFAQLHTSTSRAAVLTFTMPMMSAALAWVVLGERPGRRGAVSLALGGAGVAVLAWPVLSGLRDGGSVLGLLFPLLAALAWAIGTVAAKRWPPVGDRVVLTTWQLGIGALCGTTISRLIGEAAPVQWPPALLGAIAFHVVIATALGYALWFWLLEHLSATASTLTTLAVPVVGVLGAMALVGDRPGVLDAVGFVAVLGAAALSVPWRARPRAVAASAGPAAP